MKVADKHGAIKNVVIHIANLKEDRMGACRKNVRECGELDETMRIAERGVCISRGQGACECAADLYRIVARVKYDLIGRPRSI